MVGTRWIAALCIVVALGSGCTGPNGPDGRDGEAFITVTSTDGQLWEYVDDNYSRPGYFVPGQPYHTDPGLYNFSYESRWYFNPPYYYYKIWNGTYEIWINEGEPGGEGKWFWREGDPGKDGRDSYLTLIYNYNGYYESRANLSLPYDGCDGDTMSVRQAAGRFGITVTYRLKEHGCRCLESRGE